MKSILIASLAFAAAIAVSQAEEKKTFSEKAGSTLEKIGEKTKDAGRSVAEGTKKAADSVVDAVTPDKDARKVDVRLAAGEIQMPASVPAGKTAFVVTNAGKEKHNFEIRGEGIEKKFMLNLSPDETKTLHLDLKPGTYQVRCPMKDHDEEGLRRVLTVK